MRMLHEHLESFSYLKKKQNFDVKAFWKSINIIGNCAKPQSNSVSKEKFERKIGFFRVLKGQKYP